MPKSLKVICNQELFRNLKKIGFSQRVFCEKVSAADGALQSQRGDFKTWTKARSLEKYWRQLFTTGHVEDPSVITLFIKVIGEFPVEESQVPVKVDILNCLEDIRDGTERPDDRYKNRFSEIQLIDLSKPRGGEKIFGGWQGKCVNCNAAMRWEAANKDAALDIHEKRYKNPKLEMVDYYYPVLASSSISDRIELVKRLLFFFRNLKKRNVPEEKLAFYLPPNLDLKKRASEKNLDMTFLYGNQHGRNTVMYFQQNALFIDQNIPRFAFLIRNRDFFERVDKLVRGSQEELQGNLEKHTLTEFLHKLSSLRLPDT